MIEWSNYRERNEGLKRRYSRWLTTLSSLITSYHIFLNSLDFTSHLVYSTPPLHTIYSSKLPSSCFFFSHRKYHRTAIARTDSPEPPQCLKHEDQVTIIIHHAMPCWHCPLHFKCHTLRYHIATHIVLCISAVRLRVCCVVVWRISVTAWKSNFFLHA